MILCVVVMKGIPFFKKSKRLITNFSWTYMLSNCIMIFWQILIYVEIFRGKIIIIIGVNGLKAFLRIFSLNSLSLRFQLHC